MTVGEMLDRISSSELTEWAAYHQLDPIGPERDDLRAGMIAAPLLNAWSSKGGRKAKPSQWLLGYQDKEPQSAEQMRLLLEGYAAAAKAKAARASAPRTPTKVVTPNPSRTKRKKR